MTQLQVIDIWLTGSMPNPIPACIISLTHLTSISLQSANGGGWSGPINGVQWQNLTSLQTMFLQGNLLTGAFPVHLPASLQTLLISGINGGSTSVLSLSNVAWSSNSALTSLTLDYNSYLGFGLNPNNAIPLGLQYLSIYGTNYPGVGSLKLISWQNYSALKTITISGLLIGPIPSNFGNLPHLTALDLSNNALNGSVGATNWTTMPMLQSVKLDYNQFSTWDNAFVAGPASLQTISAVQNTFPINGTFPSYLLSSPAFINV